jgi:hypothetical protein
VPRRAKSKRAQVSDHRRGRCAFLCCADRIHDLVIVDVTPEVFRDRQKATRTTV